MEKLLQYDPILIALLATIFTWFLTAVGASMVFFFKTINKKISNSMLGFAAGVMLAVSFWSLLYPAIGFAKANEITAWIPVVGGFLAGSISLYLIDKLLPHLHMGLSVDKAEGIKTKWSRSFLLTLAITLHNIPEGLAIGVAFGVLASDANIISLQGAIALAIGIGIQNLPEGAAISIPLRREGFSRLKAFNYGQLSAIVEPIGGVLGAYLVTTIKPVLPFALSFAAGAMIFVVVEELIPESQIGDETDLSTLGAILGFALMMLLDIGFS